MSKEYCQKVRVSAMAIRDNEVPQLSAEEVNEHVKSCADCRSELKQQEEVIKLLDAQSRQLSTEDICSKIAVTIEESKAGMQSRRELWSFIVLGFILLVFKIIEVLPGVAAGVITKLMPVAAVLVFFGLLKHNPFKVNKNLRFEGGIR
jgi:predicted anti-sigma-YlaC factor YlaD